MSIKALDHHIQVAQRHPDGWVDGDRVGARATSDEGRGAVGKVFAVGFVVGNPRSDCGFIQVESKCKRVRYDRYHYRCVAKHNHLRCEARQFASG